MRTAMCGDVGSRGGEPSEACMGLPSLRYELGIPILGSASFSTGTPDHQRCVPGGRGMACRAWTGWPTRSSIRIWICHEIVRAAPND